MKLSAYLLLFALPSVAAAYDIPDGAELLSVEQRHGYECHLIEYGVPDGDRVQAYFLVPDGVSAEDSRPAIVMLHDHGARFDIGKEKLTKPLPEASGNIKRSSRQWVRDNFDGVYMADSLASLGYVVIVPDMLYWGSRCSEACREWSRLKFGNEDGYAGGHAGEIIAPDCGDRLDSLKKAVYEGQRAVYDSLYAEGVIWAEKTLEEDACAVELLKSLEYVDEDRIAVLGWSMGAHRAWLLAGFCADVATGVSVGWMTLKETLGPQLKASDYAMLIPALREKYDFPDIARLLAPKPYCFLSGREDRLFPAESTERAFERMRNIYSDAGAGGLLETGFVDGPHHCGKEAQAAATAFLERIFGMHD